MVEGIKLKISEDVEELLEGTKPPLPVLDTPFPHHW